MGQDQTSGKKRAGQDTQAGHRAGAPRPPLCVVLMSKKKGRTEEKKGSK